jgi:hypothetical protein
MKLVHFITSLFLHTGCSTPSTQYKSRPFFLTEEEVTTSHGRKAWYDRTLETDPSGAEFTVAADYHKHRQRRSRCCRSPTWVRANSLSTSFRCLRAAIRSAPAGDGATPTTCATLSRAI